MGYSPSVSHLQVMFCHINFIFHPFYEVRAVEGASRKEFGIGELEQMLNSLLMKA